MTAREELQALLMTNRVTIFNSLLESAREMEQAIGRLDMVNPDDKEILDQAVCRRRELADEIHQLMRKHTKEMLAESKS